MRTENKTTGYQYTITNNRCKIEFMNSLIDVHLVKWWLVHKTAKMSDKSCKDNWQVKKVVLIWCDNFLKPKSSLIHVLFTYMHTIIIGHTDYYENNIWSVNAVTSQKLSLQRPRNMWTQLILCGISSFPRGPTKHRLCNSS